MPCKATKKVTEGFWPKHKINSPIESGDGPKEIHDPGHMHKAAFHKCKHTQNKTTKKEDMYRCSVLFRKRRSCWSENTRHETIMASGRTGASVTTTIGVGACCMSVTSGGAAVARRLPHAGRARCVTRQTRSMTRDTRSKGTAATTECRQNTRQCQSLSRNHCPKHGKKP